MPPDALRRLAHRRSFLRLAAGAAGGVGLAATARATGAVGPLEVPQWSRTPGAPVASPAYGQPSLFERLGRRPRTPPHFPGAASTGTPLQHLHGIITPNGLHFERHHAGVPAIEPDRHRLAIHGLVERPLVLTLNDLLRMPAVSRIHFLECSGNTPWLGAKPSWTLQESHGLLSCSEWTGVELSTLLDEVGVKPGAAWILAEGADASGMSRSLPLDLARDGAILAYAQNGERLRPEQGYPLRLFVPGVEGNLSVKWLRRLKVGDQPFQTREETAKYTDLMPDGTARQFTFVMEAKSVITTPSGGERLGEPGFREIRGLAWTGRGRIARVEVSTDGGARWQAATLEGPVLPRCLTRFRLPWRWEGGPAQLLSRATDETGYVQPDRAALVAVRGTQSFYHNNATFGWQVAADGGVSHAG
ncbi:sulfite dehydrogenase [Methylobacterium goesingense]|uniref:Sulfane dehydrogenase subunit SoxC n=1 Tax=Methylobacterium goesingense TaxID=243690 RepID=A0ABV2LAV9_9HYPH|nr:sulfite dehydrogenase [Methylobacterium goesingense]GJD75150.1 Protein-methionine-sulfoxide reductase catalytic subunit MsrP [Methylobacterium goesingense]